MKIRRIFAVLLTALFIAPFFPALGEGAPAFRIDEGAILQGMSRSWRQGYAPSFSKGRWRLVMPVACDGAPGSVTAELVMPEDQATPFRKQEMSVSVRQETKGVWGVRFALEMLSNQKNADYPCVIRLSGKQEDGTPFTEDLPYTVQIRGKKDNAEKVRIEVSDVQADLNVGEESEIRVTLTNPCRLAAFEDLELRISDSAGHILPRSAETLAVGSLGIGESVTVAYPVTVLEKASVAPHVLKLDLSWNALGQAATFTANHTVSLHQEIRLEQGGVKMAPVATAGDSISLTLPLMNMGKADVVNVLATVSMPGVTERQSVLVGTIQPGETKQAQLVLSPAKDVCGEFTGTLSVECTDQDRNPASFTLPLSLTVEKPAEPEKAADTGIPVKKTEKPYAVWGLGGGCGALFLALLLQGILLRRKLHRLEEERL